MIIEKGKGGEGRKEIMSAVDFFFLRIFIFTLGEMGTFRMI